MTTDGYVIDAATAVVEADEVLYVAKVPEGPILVLEDVSRVVWREALTESDEPIETRIAAMFEGDPSNIAASIRAFLDEMVAAGILHPKP